MSVDVLWVVLLPSYVHYSELSQSPVCWLVTVIPVLLVSSCPTPTSVDLLPVVPLPGDVHSSQLS
jgi:hypothetical protein